MKKVGCITSSEVAELYYDEQYLIQPFAKAGISLIPVIWDQAIAYDHFDLLVFRSAWDYHKKTAAFEKWLTELKTISTPIYNPVSIILQNYDKYYLKSLQERGFSIIPTLFFENVKELNLKQVLLENNWQKGVIKPTISMSAYHTYAFDQNNCDVMQKELINYYGTTKVMVQKFSTAIIQEGEWSIVFYDKKYCMAALKKPKRGDFRVQGELGGTVNYLDPPAHIIKEAQVILESYPEDILYARMDGIIENGHFQLMEAELIDPELYFRAGEKGRHGYLKALWGRL